VHHGSSEVNRMCMRVHVYVHVVCKIKREMKTRVYKLLTGVHVTAHGYSYIKIP
jgi:hypothetical protein